MTPEELNRTIDFIVQSQARLAVAQEQDREWSKELLAQMAVDRQRIAKLIEIQSRRLDQNEEEHRQFRKAQREAQAEARKQHEETLARLDRILDRLMDRMN